MKNCFLFILVFLCIKAGYAQSVTIDPRANTTPIVDIKSTKEGMLMPKMTVAQRNAITGLTAGTQVYCTNCNPYGPYVYDGGSWLAMFQTQTVSPITYTVGQAAQGGIVFWIDPASGGQHGLVAATSDVGYYDTSTGLWWGRNLDINDYRWIGAFSKGMYGGELNTRIAQNMITHNNYMVFTHVFAYKGGGYGEWYLPAIDELKELYNKRNIIGMSSIRKYWSSTEDITPGVGGNNVLGFDFSTGTEFSSAKDFYFFARPVRRF